MRQIDESALQKLIKPGTRYLLQKFTHPGSTMLEIGSGPGQYRLVAKGLYIGVDITADDYREGVPRIIDALADARNLPFQKASFDLVFFSNIFHYFEDGIKILSECRQITKPGGRILIVDYSLPSLNHLKETYRLTSPGFTAQPFSSQDWLDMLRSAGYANPSIQINSQSMSSRILKGFLPGKFFNSYLDTRELSLAIIGEN